ncbi:hypothetical protein, partial [uncultured Gimesia sp.]|uniref:hypothetical protein n=1 Tax=uncultured Gimesia sp. TaxID=1678688 RepID=UPI0026398DC0
YRLPLLKFGATNHFVKDQPSKLPAHKCPLFIDKQEQELQWGRGVYRGFWEVSTQWEKFFEECPNSRNQPVGMRFLTGFGTISLCNFDAFNDLLDFRNSHDSVCDWFTQV